MFRGTTPKKKRVALEKREARNLGRNKSRKELILGLRRSRMVDAAGEKNLKLPRETVFGKKIGRGGSGGIPHRGSSVYHARRL